MHARTRYENASLLAALALDRPPSRQYFRMLVVPSRTVNRTRLLPGDAEGNLHRFANFQCVLTLVLNFTLALYFEVALCFHLARAAGPGAQRRENLFFCSCGYVVSAFAE